MSWGTDVDAWRDFQRTAGLPNSTIELRTYHVRRAGRDLARPPDEVELEHLVEWLASKGWKPNTRRSYRASLRSFYGWALYTGRVRRSPAHQLPPVKVPRTKAKRAPETAYTSAQRIADDRALLAIRLAGTCGLRRGELARSRRDWLERDLLGWTLHVVGKGGRERWVPVPDDLAQTILRRPAGYLFPSPRGGHLTPHHLGKIVSTCLPGDLTTHSLRHRAGYVSYDGTKDIRAVQEFLGHAKLDTVMIYTEVPPASIRAAMEAAA